MSEEVNGRKHHYHAEAKILSGSLRLPLVQEIKPQAHVSLHHTGGYISQRAELYRLEGVMSFKSAYTHVAGNRSLKPGHGWSTLTTTAIEGLNVMDIVTADRIVGQTITEHPLEGYVPRVSFLGTRFENLRIAGSPIEIDLDVNILGGKPANDASYTLDEELVARVKNQYALAMKSKGIPEELHERYHRLHSALGNPDTIECSLVNQVKGNFPGRSHGPVIDVPDFGKIVLGTVALRHEGCKPGGKSPAKTIIQLTMLDLQMGCAGDGNVPVGGGSTNGETIP